MGRTLARSVTVFADGEYHPYEAGQEVPDDHADKITAPDVWEDEQTESEDEIAEQYRSMTVPELKDLADERDVDISKATRKEHIVAAIVKAEQDAG